MALIKFGDLLVDPRKVVGYNLNGQDLFGLEFVGGLVYKDPGKERDDELQEDLEGLLATDLFVEVTVGVGYVNRLAIAAIGPLSPDRDAFIIWLNDGRTYEVLGYGDGTSEIRDSLIASM